jgi:hypothetical protein
LNRAMITLIGPLCYGIERRCRQRSSFSLKGTCKAGPAAEGWVLRRAMGLPEFPEGKVGFAVKLVLGLVAAFIWTSGPGAEEAR